jgi:glutathione-regulated potassium-efflux system ancillary protein KefG
MARVLVLFAHPRLEKSRTNAALLRHAPRRTDVTFRDLYEQYPDFNVDVSVEQRLLLEHDVFLWHHPLYWYSAPPLVKQWIDLVLAFGWAYGPGGTALRGKAMGHVVTTGGARGAYQLDGFHGFTLDEFLRPLERTVTLCGMTWLPPFAVHGTHRLTDDVLEDEARRYGQYLNTLAERGAAVSTPEVTGV